MAQSTELEQTTEALVRTREYMVGQYNDLLTKIRLSQQDFLYVAKTGVSVPGVNLTIPYTTDEGEISFSMSFWGFYVNHTPGIGMRLARNKQPDVKDVPLTIEIGVHIDDPSNPISLNFAWDEGEIREMYLASEESRIMGITQETIGDALLRGPEFPSGAKAPSQLLGLEFWWLYDRLHSWRAQFGLMDLEHEFDVHLVISSLGGRIASGDRHKEYTLPRSLIMHEVLDNIIEQKPALRGAYFL